MDNRTVHLKVKVLSLGAECKIIRVQERKAKKSTREDRLVLFNSLRNHRLFLRGKAREAHLAYGFVRGVPYVTMEAKTYQPPNWESVKKVLETFNKDTAGFDEWAGIKK